MQSIRAPATSQAGVPAGLAEVPDRRRWIAGGLALQFVGGAIPGLVMWRIGRAEQLAGEISKYTVRLAWHDALHTPLGLAALLVGLTFVVAGSVVLARPFVRRRRTLMIAVPAAAVVGFLILGALIAVVALVVWLLWATDGGIDLPVWPDWPARRRRR